MAERLLLVHGAWATPEVWDPLIAALGDVETKPVDVTATGEPRTSSTQLVERIVSAIDGCEAPIVVIAHSGGAALVQQAVESRPDAVSGIVYIAGIVLPPGTDFTEACAHRYGRAERVGIGRWLESTADAVVVPPEAGAAVFFHDLDAPSAIAASRAMVPQDAAALGIAPSWTPGGLGRVRQLYVGATRDRTVPIELQRELCARCGIESVVELPTGHVPHLSHPGQTARVIQDFLRSLTAEEEATEGTERLHA